LFIQNLYSLLLVQNLYSLAISAKGVLRCDKSY